MTPKYMSVEELTATRNAVSDANDEASLLSLAQRLGRHFPDDPAARQLLADIASKREHLRPGAASVAASRVGPPPAVIETEREADQRSVGRDSAPGALPRVRGD